MSSEEQSLRVVASAEDANIDVPVVPTADPTSTVIKEEVGGLTSLTVTTDHSEDGAITPPEAVEEGTAEKTEEALEAKSTKVEEYSKLWAEQGGSLTEEQWDSASSTLGIDKADLLAYEAYRKTELSKESSSHDDTIYKLSGGQDKYDTMIDWAEGNLSTAQIDALNMQLDNPAFSEMGVTLLKTLYTQSVGQEPSKSTIDKAPSAPTVSGFMSEVDMLAAQRHPEYGQGGLYDIEFDKKALAFMKRTKQI